MSARKSPLMVEVSSGAEKIGRIEPAAFLSAAQAPSTMFLASAVEQFNARKEQLGEPERAAVVLAAAPIFQVAIIDCDKAGIIGGPFKVIVLKDGRQIASTSGIQGPTGANGVARNYGFAYNVPEASVARVAA
jgi:hypothetical protein